MSSTIANNDILGRLAAAFPGREISDVQVRTGGLIYLHTNRGLEVAEAFGIQDADAVARLAEGLYTRQSVEIWSDTSAAGSAEQMWEKVRSRRVIDFSCEEGALGSPVRMRVQVHLSEHGMGVTCRWLRAKISQLETLGIDPMISDSLRELMQRRFGLGLITGPTGSGKSTTLAAILDWVRRNFQKHIVTIEDPIEYRYDTTMEDPNQPGMRMPAPSLVTQQEVGRHTISYQSGLKEVLRKTPNIILIGEIRDRETMETCIEAAQTGHFVLSTLHTRGAVKTIDRILEFFPKEQQPGILHRLSETLTFVLSQGLLTGFNGRLLVTEYLQNTSDAVAAGMRAYDGSATSLADSLRYKGNLRWDQCLMNHYRAGLVSEDVFNANLLG
ncbi:ATPase, T2SS/T4P/T4SS family [Prosthecobacter sp. SYSU 5D2]|uniref:type IV pilus twitching motility protein PilT n=1 Tax=Prosthecobacter sp. SYSU 5D2 TaxID=3134134 RepID=UPI0031FF3698